MEERREEGGQIRNWKDNCEKVCKIIMKMLQNNCDESYLGHFIYSYIILINFKISKKKFNV